MKKIFNRIIAPILKRRYIARSKKKQHYSFRNIELVIYPSVFSPKDTITTELFADYLLEQEWKDKTVLELGAGSGIISFLLAKAGAQVTASDINPAAIKGLSDNNLKTDKKIAIKASDLFQNIVNQFDTIIVNPPFFNEKPMDMREKAWYCGTDYEFFKLLFSEFYKRNIYRETILMVLSSKSNVAEIIGIAELNNLHVTLEKELSRKGERHFIFKIKSK